MREGGCPLGFGGPGAGRGELSPYHCVLCRGLLHNPRKVNGCQHVFCDFCIRRFRDCPVCGADIEGTSLDASLAESIGKLLIGHAKLAAKSTSSVPPLGFPGATATAVAPAAAGCPAVAAASTSGASLDLPSLLLQLALQSLAGGNPEAALARLDMCAEALCSPVEAADQATKQKAGATGLPASCGSSDMLSGAVSSDKDKDGPVPASGASDSADPVINRCLRAGPTNPDTASRLGAVLGCKADCYRRLGDTGAAHRHYTASLACLASWRGRSREADSALSVTYNKLGDLLMLVGRLPEAREQYDEALSIRRQTLASGAIGVGAHQPSRPPQQEQQQRQGQWQEGQQSEERAHDVCDLATSLCKVADVCLALLSERTQPPLTQQQLHPQEQHDRPPEGLQQELREVGQSGAQPTTEGPQDEAALRDRPAQLLAEARRWLLSPEMLPYARTSGLQQAVAAAAAASRSGTPQHGGSGAPEAAEGAQEGVSGGNDGPRPATGKEGGASAGGGTAGPGAHDSELPLAPQLLQRYGRVWGALEQLTMRMRGVQEEAGP